MTLNRGKHEMYRLLLRTTKMSGKKSTEMLSNDGLSTRCEIEWKPLSVLSGMRQTKQYMRQNIWE